jgi:hypothetical protein
MSIIHDNIKGCEFIIMYKSGHGACLEKIHEFATVICGFVFKHSKGKTVDAQLLSNPVLPDTKQ